MKIRNGFVSNSSSSSFIIITDGTELEDVVEKFNAKLENIKHPFVSLAAKIFEYIGENAKELESLQDFMDEMYIDDEEELKDQYPEIAKLNFEKCKVYEMEVGSESGEPIEYYLYENIDVISEFNDGKKLIFLSR